MVLGKDIFLASLDFLISVGGGLRQDYIMLVVGIFILFLNVNLSLSEIEDDVKILKAQINTQNELKNSNRD